MGFADLQKFSLRDLAAQMAKRQAIEVQAYLASIAELTGGQIPVQVVPSELAEDVTYTATQPSSASMGVCIGLPNAGKVLRLKRIILHRGFRTAAGNGQLIIGWDNTGPAGAALTVAAGTIMPHDPRDGTTLPFLATDASVNGVNARGIQFPIFVPAALGENLPLIFDFDRHLSKPFLALAQADSVASATEPLVVQYVPGAGGASGGLLVEFTFADLARST